MKELIARVLARAGGRVPLESLDVILVLACRPNGNNDPRAPQKRRDQQQLKAGSLSDGLAALLYSGWAVLRGKYIVLTEGGRSIVGEDEDPSLVKLARLPFAELDLKARELVA